MKKRGKRGQFYIMAAIIIVGILAGIFIIKNYARTEEAPEKFYDLSEDLDLESGKVIDYGIYNQENINELVDNFTEAYYNYTKNKLDAGQWIFVHGNESNKITVITYSKVSSGNIGILIGNQQTNIEMKEDKKTVSEPINVIDEAGKKKFKMSAFNANYTFELEQGENFYFLIGEGGEYVEKN